MALLPPSDFASRWIAAWNARDVDAVLTHYATDVVFSSPTAARYVPESNGVVHGKPALRQYWELALAGNPDLHFELLGVYAGVDTLILHYRNQTEAMVCEALTFRDGLVVNGQATHLLPEESAGRRPH